MPINAGNVVSGGEVFTIGAGQVLSNATVESGGTLEVASGGTDSTTMVLSGGYLTVSSGAIIGGGDVVSGGGTLAVTGLVVSSGQNLVFGASAVVDGITVSDGGVAIDSGGTVLSGGTVTVANGGAIGEGYFYNSNNGTFIEHGGVSVIQAGATLQLFGGADYGSNTIYGVEVISGAPALYNYYDVIEAGGTLIVSAGAFGSASIDALGVAFVAGYASLEDFGGTAVALSGGTIKGLDLAGAEFDVNSGGTVQNSYISNGALLRLDGATFGSSVDVLSGANVVEGGASVSAGQTLTVAPNTSSLITATWSDTLLSGVTSASGTMVGSGGHFNVSSGGVATATSVLAGASEVVAGRESGAMVASGGYLGVVAGGSASSVTLVGSGAQMNVASGGVAAALASANTTAVTLNGGTLDNSGVVSAGGTSIAGGVAVNITGGTLTNRAGGLIEGGVHGAFGAGVQMNAGTVDNAGTITAIADTAGAGGGPALYMTGGSLDNTGLIAGGASTINDNNYGLGLILAAGTVTNEGTILGGGSPQGGATGVNLDGGTLINTGLIEGGASGAGGDSVGVYLGGGTLITAGTIEANPTGSATNQAILFAGADTMVVEPGAAFIGAVQANSTDTIELAGTASGTLAGFGTQITGLGTLVFDAGSDWTVAGSAAGLASISNIAGFLPGETIDVTDFTATGSSYVGGLLTLYGSGGNLTLDLPGLPGTDRFEVTTSGTTSVITALSTVATVSDTTGLSAAIRADDLASLAGVTAAYTIDLANNITLSAALDAVNLGTGSSLTINGAGNTLDGGGTYNGLFVYAGAVSVDDLTIADTVAQGGAGGAGGGVDYDPYGGAGGGGGAGLGGGLFVAAGGTVGLVNVSFRHASAIGGTGGANSSLLFGGGGGLDGGSGGRATVNNNGDFEGGGGGIGAAGGSSAGSGGAGLVPGAGPGGSTPFGAGGASGGGGGGGVVTAGAGGGVNGAGNGGFGGGAGGYIGGGNKGGFGGGGAGPGGAGGFGGGGSGRGGSGGFGGGNGGSVNGTSGPGGGGLGAGGDIFVQQGASLFIGAGALGAGSVSDGPAGGNSAGSGLGFGSGLFIQGNQVVTLAPGIGATLDIAGVIADQNGAWFSLGNTTPDAGTSGDGTANAGVGTLDIGAGIVALQAANTFSGPVIVQAGGAIQIAADDNLGIYNVGATVDGNVLTLEAGSTLDFTGGFTLDHRITLAGDPTFVVSPGTIDTISSLIADGTAPGTLELTGDGTLVLTDTDTYSGGTTVEGDSTLLAEATNALGTGPLTVAAGSTVADPASNTATVTTGNAAQAVTNAGTITAGGNGFAGGVAVYVNGGTLINQAGGLIEGGTHGSFGAGVQMAGGTVSNAGTITAIADTTGVGGGPGVYMAGGSLDNTGLIAGGASTINNNNNGLGLVLGAGTVTNEGTILGGGSPQGGATGVNLDGGTLINTGLIEGGAGGNAAGVYLAGGTLITAATIEANPSGFASNWAVLFSGADSMVVEPGAAFIGAVQANSTDTIELTGTASATLAGLGDNITGLGTLSFDPGSHWTARGTAAGFASGITLAGFTTTGSLDLTDLPIAAGATAFANGTTLTLDDGTNTEYFNLATPGTGIPFFAFADAAGTGTVISSVACYCAGTRIATPAGEVAIEHLAIGDRVRTLSGVIRPIRWIGRRSYAGRFLAGTPQLWPICIRAGALADGVPTADLHVSPKHAMWLEDVLIPAEHLVNHASFVQVAPPERVDYFHIELECHDVIIANGAASETYIDTCNRGMFDNGADYAGRTGTPAEDYAPRITEGETLDRLRALLATRAAELGLAVPVSPVLEITGEGTFGIAVRADASVLRLVSPCDKEPGGQRRLGALIRGLRIDGTPIDLHDPRLASGLHDIELHNGQVLRWTNGDATLAIGAGRCDRRVEIDVVTVLSGERRAA